MPPVGPGALPQLTSNISPKEAYQNTLARLERIQNHLTTTPRSDRLKGKVCIITGVGSLKGIGRAAAFAYAHARAKHLYLLDYDDKNLPELKQTIQSTYPDVKVTVIHGDAADEDTISKLCARALDEQGHLDVFFANAGVATKQFLHNVTAKDWEKTMRINSLSVFLAVKYASKAMLKSNPAAGKNEPGGSIIATASIAGLRAGAGSIDYSASKAAVINTVQTAASQLPKTNVRVNGICPGLIETGMTVETFEAARTRGTANKLGQLNPLGRYGIAEEIAQVALFLGTDEASYVNGQVIAVDGGLSASHPIVPGKLA